LTPNEETLSYSTRRDYNDNLLLQSSDADGFSDFEVMSTTSNGVIKYDIDVSRFMIPKRSVMDDIKGQSVYNRNNANLSNVMSDDFNFGKTDGDEDHV